jgi:hypothetical protein
MSPVEAPCHPQPCRCQCDRDRPAHPRSRPDGAEQDRHAGQQGQDVEWPHRLVVKLDQPPVDPRGEGLAADGQAGRRLTMALDVEPLAMEAD